MEHNAAAPRQDFRALQIVSATAPPARLVLRLLGSFALERGAHACELTYEKGKALLAYLAIEAGRTHSRASLAALLWPDLVREAALANLRQVVHELRHALNTTEAERPLLQIERDTIRLDLAAGLELDTTGFSAPAPTCLATPCSTHCNPCLAQQEALAGCYRGEFMAGFSLPDCPDIEEWLQIQRETLHLRALVILARLADCYERMGAYAKSLPFALRFLEQEPWNEEGLRRAMRLFALNGQQATAITQYETCCRTLKRELGVLPSAETLALAEQIRRGLLSPNRRRLTDALPATNLSLPIAQRRQVTVLYCELTLLDIDDPDEALEQLQMPQARCSEIIRSHAGHLVQVRGGSLLAYFGYPQASENAARLAVQAAMAVTHTAFSGLELRAGVHTGMVISGDPQVPDAVGATSGVAIRLRQRIDCGQVAISAATQRLVAGYFKCTNLGPQPLVGAARPLEAFRVDGESGATSRLEAAARLTPLIGRQDELATLLAAWQDSRRGARRIVLLGGEAGIGKSRLILALKHALREHACIRRELRCFPEHNTSPFYPLVTLFATSLAFVSDDTPETKFDKLAEYVERHYSATDQDAVPLLAKMLSLPLRAPYREPDSSPQQQRKKLLAIILDRLYALAAEQPVLLVMEDLHWADPSTLEFLQLLVTQQRPVPVLVILTARPEFKPPWLESLADTLSLKGLDDALTTRLIIAVAPEITPAAVCRIVERADGIPLFAEELAREIAVNESSAIPPTLQDLLTARLDAMGTAKIVAQSAATIGREFDFDLLRRIARFDEPTLAKSLRQLQEAGLLWGGANNVFHFRHALMRDAAYQSQTRAEREATHRRVGAALKIAGRAARPELLAQHWAAGGEIFKAVACWIAAGKLARQHSASQEVVIHFRSGLALIEALPAGQERLCLELELQIGFGAAACAVQGYASAEGAAAYARAMELCDTHEADPDLFQAVWGLWASASSRVGYAHALELAQQLLRMARQSGDPIHEQQGQFAVGDTLFWQGKFTAARTHLERVRTLYRPAHHESHVAGFGEDAGVTSGSYLSWVQWFLGLPDQARETSAQTLVLARRLGHPFSLAYALTFAAILRCRLRDPENATALAQEALALANKHQFSLWQVGATLSHGWALAMLNCREGVESLQHCVEAMRMAMGGVTLVVLEPLVNASVILGLFDTALSVNNEALATGQAIGDHHIEAELNRLKGESLLGLSEVNEAEALACFQQALAISRRQQAKSLELRAATSMARLLLRQGKPNDAQGLLEEVLPGFTAGFDTPDLMDAHQLMSALRQNSGDHSLASGIAERI